MYLLSARHDTKEGLVTSVIVLAPGPGLVIKALKEVTEGGHGYKFNSDDAEIFLTHLDQGVVYPADCHGCDNGELSEEGPLVLRLRKRNGVWCVEMISEHYEKEIISRGPWIKDLDRLHSEVAGG